MTDLIFKKECYKIIGCAMDAHKELGSGFLEAVCQEALEVEFRNKGVSYQKEKELLINYKGQILNKKYYADFICFDEIVIELKAVSELRKEHYKQVFNYLKATDLRLALLINFGEESLEYKRIIF